MPFTLSHPAAAVPLARLRLPLSALVVGSMAPDFPYYAALDTSIGFAHTLPGLVFFCVPAGLAVLWVYHRFVKRPALDLLPLAMQRRLAPVSGRFDFGPARRLGMVALAVFVGALTHVAWDGFTNHNGWAVTRLPGLYERVDIGLPRPVEGYMALHYASTLVGAALLALWAARWLWRAPAAPVETRLSPVARGAIWAGLIVGAIAFGLYVGGGYDWVSAPFRVFRTALIQTVVGCVSALAGGLVLYSSVWHVMGRERGSERGRN